MPVVKWDPFRDLSTIHERMNRLFETALSGSDFGDEDGDVGRWAPVSDVFETDDAIVVSCELPGLSQDQIEIKLADNVLTVSGERRVDRDSEAQQFHRIERSYGPFSRSFTVPASIDASKIAANYRGGILAVILPKTAEATPRRITVRLT